MSDKNENVDVGAIVSGTVTHVADFGAFVALDGGKDGLIHISEIANEFVKDVGEFVVMGAKINVKILGLNKQGKFELSLKQVKVDDKPVEQKKEVKKVETFEDKMNSFLKKSEEKQVDIRRTLKKKQGITKKRK
jgi:S1 RNA binding domain protein